MKLVELTPFQKRELEFIIPTKKVAEYCAFISEEEYWDWYSSYYNFFLELDSAFDINANYNPFAHQSHDLRKLPVLQCVSKLEEIDGKLKPKVFKFACLPEGNMRAFGFGLITASLLQGIANTFPIKILQFPFKFKKQETFYLGYQAWSEKDPSLHFGDRYLPLFMNCAANPNMIKISNNKLIYNHEEFDYLLPSFNYHYEPQFQTLIQELHERRMLLFPLDFPLSNLSKMIGFSSSMWAETKPLDYFLEEDPEKLNEWVLIRTDNGNILTWNEVQADPVLRLEIEMDDYWIWQKRCPSPLENINLYWTFGFDYPGLVDKIDNTWIPAFIHQK